MAKTHPLRVYRAAHELTCADLAKRLGIAEPTLRSFENGHRKIGAEMAVQIERRTGGAIARHQLRADLFAKPAAELSQAAA